MNMTLMKDRGPNVYEPKTKTSRTPAAPTYRLGCVRPIT